MDIISQLSTLRPLEKKKKKKKKWQGARQLSQPVPASESGAAEQRRARRGVREPSKKLDYHGVCRLDLTPSPAERRAAVMLS